MPLVQTHLHASIAELKHLVEDVQGLTPLHLALHEEHGWRPDGRHNRIVSEPIVRALLAHGASVSAKDNVVRVTSYTPKHDHL